MAFNAGNLLRGESLCLEHRGLHEIAALVVRDEADAQPLLGEPPGEFGNGGGFARAEEPPVMM